MVMRLWSVGRRREVRYARECGGRGRTSTRRFEFGASGRKRTPTDMANAASHDDESPVEAVEEAGEEAEAAEAADRFESVDTERRGGAGLGAASSLVNVCRAAWSCSHCVRQLPPMTG